MAKITKTRSSPATDNASKKRTGKRKRPQPKRTKSKVSVDPRDKPKAPRSSGQLPPPEASHSNVSPEVLNRLWAIIESRKAAEPETSHSARLLAKGAPRVAQKLGEEAVECLIEVMAGNRIGVIEESADLLYHILVTWVHAGIRPEEVWQKPEQRESASQQTEGFVGPIKRLLGSMKIGTTKIP
jgi:phosphoribosyl-ATP pyrophosphohydrolase